MAEETKKNGQMDGCSCPGCRCGMGMGMMGMGHRHGLFFLLRILVTIIILMVVFWFGVQVGRLSGEFGRGRFMMDGYGYYGGTTGVYNSGGGVAIPPQQMPMMRINGATSTPTPGVPNNY